MELLVNPLHLAIALGPLAVYFLLLGFINAQTKPFLTTGARDLAALGIGVCGFFFAGPMELFLPAAGAWQYFGSYVVWLLLASFYFLTLTLIVLLLRPRIVIYNVTVEQLRPILAEVVARLDPGARWAGESLQLPKLGVQLHLDSFRALKNSQLVASGPNQDYGGWRKLEVALAQELRNTTGTANPYAATLLALGGAIWCVLAYYLVVESREVAQSLREMFRL